MSSDEEIPSKLLTKDCFECRLTGSLSCAAIGAYVFYHSTASYYLKRPYVRFAVRSIGAAFMYGGLARWFYLPPFHSLKGSQPVTIVKRQ
ncbi:hypothetical protein KIN20_020289 [Parelaphostrongylus tenuis]|uniref:DUF4536 domain-containing protein n=1 Tax=Parelaphostrongylus tenuis TaxID=148309 RepID=A0AAD5MMC8_PARTN|nr:hypothetical protein KIN20_020289 [Parelaphostrongylus tenuis]